MIKRLRAAAVTQPQTDANTIPPLGYKIGKREAPQRNELRASSQNDSWRALNGCNIYARRPNQTRLIDTALDHALDHSTALQVALRPYLPIASPHSPLSSIVHSILRSIYRSTSPPLSHRAPLLSRCYSFSTAVVNPLAAEFTSKSSRSTTTQISDPHAKRHKNERKQPDCSRKCQSSTLPQSHFSRTQSDNKRRTERLPPNFRT